MAHSGYSNSLYSNSSVVGSTSYLASDIHISDSYPTPPKSRDEVAHPHDAKFSPINPSNQPGYNKNSDQWMDSEYERNYQYYNSQYQCLVPPQASFHNDWTAAHHPYMPIYPPHPSVTASHPLSTHSKNKVNKNLLSTSITIMKNKDIVNPTRKPQTCRRIHNQFNQEQKRKKTTATLEAYDQKDKNFDSMLVEVQKIHGLYESLDMENTRTEQLLNEVIHLYNEISTAVGKCANEKIQEEKNLIDKHQNIENEIKQKKKNALNALQKSSTSEEFMGI